MKKNNEIGLRVEGSIPAKGKDKEKHYNYILNKKLSIYKYLQQALKKF
jgi:hypothetical protein